MAHRANFVIVEHGDWRLYYSHRAGRRILDPLVGGPDHALRYTRALRPCAKGQWVEALWADGGAVVDLDRRRLLFFGDELMSGVNERRAVLAVLAQVWPDYAIGWAYDGTAELAGYVGADVPPRTWETLPKLQLGSRGTEVSEVVSVLDANGRIRLWPLRWHRSKAWHGPALLDTLPGRGVKGLTLGRIPEGGVHIDVPRKAVGVWHTADTSGVFQALTGLWDGWRTDCWEDRIDQQVRRCQGALRVPAVDLMAGVDRARDELRCRVFAPLADGPAGRITETGGAPAPVRPEPAVGDAAGESRVRPTPGQWAHFTAACDRVGGRAAESA